MLKEQLQEAISLGRGVFYCDNLDAMRVLYEMYGKAGCIDLCYIDPPFNSKRDYNRTFGEVANYDQSVQEMIFKDTWSNVNYEENMQLLRDKCKEISAYEYLCFIQKTYRNNRAMTSYLSLMAVRISYIHKLLKSTGSFYLHCDTTMSHYLKVLCDLIFGRESCRNEIVWCYSRPSAPRQRQFSRVHDVLLFYSKGKTWTFQPDSIRQSYAESSVDRSGYAANTSKVARGEGLVKLNEGGKFPEDWMYVPPLKGNAKEYKGYRTQKPQALLRRIIEASSRPGDLVVDFFAGCGTTICVAEELKRRWLGVDIQMFAIKLIENDLRINYEDPKVVIGGIPKSKDQFYEWIDGNDPGLRYKAQLLLVTDLLEGVCNKKGADGGFDGWRHIYIPTSKREIKQLIEVKTGKRLQLKDLSRAREVALRERAPMLFVCPEVSITDGMREMSAQAGTFILKNLKGKEMSTKIPNLTILSIEDVFNKRDGFKLLCTTHAPKKALQRSHA